MKIILLVLLLLVGCGGGDPEPIIPDTSTHDVGIPEKPDCVNHPDLCH